jgi:hypothetical protein
MTNETKIKIKKALDSKLFRIVLYVLGTLIVVFFIFQAGMIVGFRRVSFDRDWGNNYAMNFGAPHIGPQIMGGRLGDFSNLPNAYGAIGKIIRVELPTIVVLDEKDNTEKIVLINDKTQIRRLSDSVNQNELKVDDHIIVIGVPNPSGQIEARLIRFLPAPLPVPINN